MEDSKKSILIVAIIWATLFMAMNFVIVEKLPYWWSGHYGDRHKIQGNIMVGSVIILLIIVIILPKSMAQKKRDLIDN